MAAKKPTAPTKKFEFTPDQCRMIQWGQLHLDENQQPICPKCGAPAENIIGFVGEPCWAHVPWRTDDATKDDG